MGLIGLGQSRKTWRAQSQVFGEVDGAWRSVMLVYILVVMNHRQALCRILHTGGTREATHWGSALGGLDEHLPSWCICSHDEDATIIVTSTIVS